MFWVLDGRRISFKNKKLIKNINNKLLTLLKYKDNFLQKLFIFNNLIHKTKKERSVHPDVKRAELHKSIKKL